MPRRSHSLSRGWARRVDDRTAFPLVTSGVILEMDPVEICTRGPFSTMENGLQGPYFTVVNGPPCGKWTLHMDGRVALPGKRVDNPCFQRVKSATFKINSLNISFVGGGSTTSTPLYMEPPKCFVT